MSKSKKAAADARKEASKTLYMAKLRNNPTSPRKTRIMANVIRGKQVDYAMNVLKYSHKESAEKILKLLKSAVANWQVKNEGVRLENADLYIKTIMVDGGRTLKRFRPAPQGRANRIRKRSNHITLVIADRNAEKVETTEQPEPVETIDTTKNTVGETIKDSGAEKEKEGADEVAKVKVKKETKRKAKEEVEGAEEVEEAEKVKGTEEVKGAGSEEEINEETKK